MPETSRSTLDGIAVHGRVSVWSPKVPFRPGRLQILVTTRHGGVSSKPWDSLNLSPSTGDEREDVDSTRQRLRRDTEMPEPRWLHQVHGDVVVNASELATIPGGTLQADGLWTQEENQVGQASRRRRAWPPESRSGRLLPR